jgi:glycosyltransferase involved in cell wall biosynthesis
MILMLECFRFNPPKSEELKIMSSLNSLVDPNFIMQVNPQGVVGIKALAYMNTPGTTTLGGQIPYVINQGLALSKHEKIQADFKVTRSQKVLVDLKVKRPFFVSIASQKAVDSFGNDFKNKYENNKGSQFQVVRYPLFEKNGKCNPFIDKEDVDANNQNAYYGRLRDWGRTVAKDALSQGKIPGKVLLNYWDSYVAYHAMLEYWKEKGLTQMPKTVAIPHSLGYRKLITMLKSQVQKEWDQAKGNDKDLSTKEKVDSIYAHLEPLLDDPKTCFPARILIEREMFSHPEIKGSLNSNVELQEQLLSGPYLLDFKSLPKVQEKFSTVINPGIDTLRFGAENHSFMQKHENFAEKYLTEALKRDIPLNRRKLPIILAVGRLNFDKNFHGVAHAFLNHPELSEKANLVFVINGKDKHLNINYIDAMQKVLRNDPDKNETLLESFTGSTKTQLERLSTILDRPEAKGTYTAVSLPDGCDFAGLQRYLGKNAMAISGLFSFKEPYGLAPLESMISGIPVVVSKYSGVAPEVISAQGESFDPNRHQEIASALLKTLEKLEEKRSAHMKFAQNKTWDKPVNNLIDWMNHDAPKTLGTPEKLLTKTLDIASPQFIHTGKELIRLAIQKEIEEGLLNQKGIFSELGQSVG